MTAPAEPQSTTTDPAEDQQPAPAAPTDPQADSDPTPAPEADPDESTDDLPDWARKKLDKVQREAQNLRTRLKEQEPLVTAAQEAERKNMSELDRTKSDYEALQKTLAQRDTELLAARYQLTDEDLEFIGEGTFEEKEARAKKFAARVQQTPEDPTKPPTQRPVESLKPGASPTPPPAVDNSYPASWGFQPPTQ